METTEKVLIGVDLLSTLDRVLIRETQNCKDNTKYVVLAADGTVMLYAKEDADFVNRMLGNSRTLLLNVFDSNNKEVMKFRRPYSMGTDKMDVTLCGQPAAIVRKEMTFFKPVLSINDLTDRQVIRVKGPMFITSECNFELYSSSRVRIGDISKRWSGTPGCAGKTTFAARFPIDLDVGYKTAIIGTCFLIDFLFYEN